jgi:hypothetical protein
MLDLSSWPKGMRVIVRKERPHPGAQLRFTDIDGHRFTCLATSTRGGQLADLELRHRRRARCAKDTGLRRGMYEQETAWAPPHVGEELRLARLQARTAWENVIRAGHDGRAATATDAAARHSPLDAPPVGGVHRTHAADRHRRGPGATPPPSRYRYGAAEVRRAQRRP